MAFVYISLYFLTHIPLIKYSIGLTIKCRTDLNRYFTAIYRWWENAVSYTAQYLEINRQDVRGKVWLSFTFSIGTSITFPLWGRLTPWPTHQSEVQTIYKMVALNDKAPSNKSTALVLTNDNEVPFYGFYGFNYHNKNLKKKNLICI